MKIEITIRPNGASTVETFGFTGEACRDATRLIEKALGKRTAEEIKAEFHQVSQTHRQQTRQ